MIRAFAPDDWVALCETYERAARCELAVSGLDPRAFRPMPGEEDLETFQRLNTTMAHAMAALGDQAWTLARDGNDPAINLYRKHGLQIVRSRSADAWGYRHTELRMALPTSRKFDSEASTFGA